MNLFRKAFKDRIKGGLADKKKPSDFDQRQLDAGATVEREHTKDPSIAREIAMDHLTEDPEYYKKLKTIEKSDKPGSQYHVEFKGHEPAAKRSGNYAQYHFTKQDLAHILSNWDKNTSWREANKQPRAIKEGTFHPTAISRSKPPTPIADYVAKFPRKESMNVLYHGVGRDEAGANHLAQGGHKMTTYDPYHSDEAIRQLPSADNKFDEVHSHYTLNVVPSHVGRQIMQEIHDRLSDDGKAVVSVRRDLLSPRALLKKSELAKGAMRRLAPYNPVKVPDKERFKAARWMTERDRYSRNELKDLAEVSPEAKARALHQLSSKTQVRVNPETKEREFLLHRGAGLMESALVNRDKSHDQLTSWTPKKSVAVAFAHDYRDAHDPEYLAEQAKHHGLEPAKDSHLLSAWIPESMIHHAPRMIEPREKGDESYSSEHEIVVKPHPLKDLQMVENPAYPEQETDVNTMINLRGQSPGYRPHQGQHPLVGKWKSRLKSRLGKSELVKGAMRRLYGKIDPQQLPGGNEVNRWVGGHGNRDKVPELPQAARMRSLNKLMRRAQWRKGPSGEREYLLHRQMGGFEYPKAVSGDKISHDKVTSWTPDFGRVEQGIYPPQDHSSMFDYQYITSAWIPESKIKSYLPMYGGTADKGGERGPMYDSTEQEVLVHPHTSDLHEVHHDNRLKEMIGAHPDDDNWDGGKSTPRDWGSWKWKKIFSKAPIQKSELKKSPYGPQGMGLYNQADNARRKMGRTSDVVAGAGPNKAVRSTKPSASQQAASIAAEARRKSKKNPVKVWTQAEINQHFRGYVKVVKKSELQKGVNQRLFPFKRTDIPSEQRSALGVWQHQGKLEDFDDPEEGKEAAREYREAALPLEGHGRRRMLNRLAAKTKVKRHPETGENMYLMFRGMDDEERDSSVKEHHVQSGHKQNTSWTPDYTIARGFASDYTNAGHEPVAAWIPERHILTMPKMVGKQSSPQRDMFDGFESFDRKGPSRFSAENEVIVAHDHSSPRATVAEVKAHRGMPTADVTNMINVRAAGVPVGGSVASTLRRKYMSKRPKKV